jgi:protein-S-isoprenylcysteine O-methyltransferase Ste14
MRHWNGGSDGIVFVPLFLIGAYYGIAGVKGTSLKVAETHRTNKIITSGVYSAVRHPQYLGGSIFKIVYKVNQL